MNFTVIHGNVGAPGQKKDLKETSVCNFTVADNIKVLDGKHTNWWKVAAWGVQSDIAVLLQKGDPVTVWGEAKLEEYQTKDGRTGQSLVMNARVVLPGRRKETTLTTRAPSSSELDIPF